MVCTKPAWPNTKSKQIMIGLFLNFLSVLNLLIIVDALLSWVMPDKTQFPRSLTARLTDPLYAPVRAILSPEKTGGLDLSPLVLILLIQALQHLLARAG
jgi:YggT family protein